MLSVESESKSANLAELVRRMAPTNEHTPLSGGGFSLAATQQRCGPQRPQSEASPAIGRWTHRLGKLALAFGDANNARRTPDRSRRNRRDPLCDSDNATSPSSTSSLPSIGSLSSQRASSGNHDSMSGDAGNRTDSTQLSHRQIQE